MRKTMGYQAAVLQKGLSWLTDKVAPGSEED
jgi:hypothetical protein